MLQQLMARIEKRYKRWDRRLGLSKRQQFVIITLLLTLGLMLTQLVSLDFRYPMIVTLTIVTYFLCAFALRDDLSTHEWVTLLILPSFFTAAVSVFYFLLPTRWLTRLPIAGLYAVGMYALLLTENIYNVAASRTIALLRAAHSVGFLLTLVTYFLLLQTLLAYRLIGVLSAVVVAVITFPLSLQLLWAMNLEERIGKSVMDLSAVIALIAFEVTLAISFLPVRTTLFAIFLTANFYGLAGMGQQYLAERMYKRTVWEFFGVVAIVFGILLLTLDWRLPV